MKFSKKQILVSTPILIIGATAIIMQIVTVQELISQFYGNEICIGTTLAFWLLWTAAGSALLPRILPRSGQIQNWLISMQSLWIFSMVFTLVFIRASKLVLHIPPGELLGLMPIMAITAISLLPFCLISGFLYTIACQWRADQQGEFSPPRVFTLESIGAGLGGLLAGLFLIKTISTTAIIFFLSGLNLLCVFSLAFKRKYISVGCSLIILIGLWSMQDRIPCIQAELDRLSYPRQQNVISQNTPYGQITLTRTERQYNIYQNGLWLYTFPDPFSAESAVHYTLLQHPAPERILMIGGGPELTREILKHPTVKQIDYIEINPDLIMFVENHVPEIHEILKDTRIHIIHADVRQFLSKSKNSYDIILSNLPNPYTNQLNRFYTVEFFQEIRDHLSSNGVFGFQVHGEENVISPELSGYLSMLSSTVREVFPDLTLLPGEIQFWLASKQRGLTFSEPGRFQERIIERGLKTQYIQPYFMQYNFSADRIKQIQDHINLTDSRNADFRPLGFYYDSILWATHFSRGFKYILTILNKWHLYQIFTVILILSSLIYLLQRRNPGLNWNRFYLLSSIGVVGFTEISLEMILILAFQILWGATYQILIVLITVYMLGLCMGSLISWKFHERHNADFHRFRHVQLVMALSVTVCMISIACCRWAQNHEMQWMALVLLPMVTFWVSGVAGFQFVLANHLYVDSRSRIANQAGALYGTDLCGSAAGAILCAAFLMPVFGIQNSLWMIIVMNIGIWILMRQSTD